uniref:putative bifunctional diguanylate cyclase/phosphodiesterase n=1 Tax=Trichloromonas sp. TaxID=3069249 RepID=UPI003D817739
EEQELVSSGYNDYREAFERYEFLVVNRFPEHADVLDDVRRMGDALLQRSSLLMNAMGLQASGETLLELKEAFERDERGFLQVIERALHREQAELRLSSERVRLEIRSGIERIAVVAALLFVGILVLSMILSGAISRPVRRLRRAAELIGAGDLEVRTEVESSDEIGDLARSFNLMAGELSRFKGELVSARDHLESVIDAMADSLVVTTSDGTIVRVNPATLCMLDYPAESLTGQPVSNVLADSQQQEKILDAMLSGEHVLDRETFYRCRDGSTVPVALSVSALPGGRDGGLIFQARNLSERREAEQEIRQLAYFDNLTGLPNRILFMDRLQQSLAQVGRDNSQLALLFLDLDQFKVVNDTLGHAAGDELLRQVANRLGRGLRQYDILARMGGDEFVLLISPVQGEKAAAAVARHILEMMAEPVVLDSKELFVTTSIGIVLAPADGSEAEVLLKHSDVAMYAAKEQGRNTYRFFSEEMNRKTLQRSELEADLRRAIRNEEFCLHYQPQVDLASGRVFGVEALVRWQHPEKGLILPGNFISLAEDTGLIRPLGEWVLKTACAQNVAWQQAGYPHIQMAVNLSGQQFGQPGFIDMIDQVLQETGLEADYLELELTESTLLHGAHEVIANMLDIKVRGIHLSIDDFGTGYSSLSYLKHFPIDRLKIDRSFVRDIHIYKDDAAIVDAIIAMGHSLGRRVLAEGVETDAELEFLRSRGCDEVQGYLYSRPLPAEALIGWMNGRVD